MISFHLLPCSASASAEDRIAEESQLQLMCRFFTAMAHSDLEVDLRSFGRMATYSTTDNLCSWIGIACAAGIMREIHWNNTCNVHALSHSMITSPAWLPPTLRIIELESFYMNCPWPTHYWPRDLFVLNASFCGIQGELKTDRLPRRLQSLRMRGNMLLGTLLLQNLPDPLWWMNLEHALLW